jgi:hypothetical protein
LAGVSFDGKDGSKISLQQAPLWIAKFGVDGSATWAKAVVTGDSGGSGQYSYLDVFSDGSVAVAGVFGTSATFAPGETNETKLVGPDFALEGYIAHYDTIGGLKWVRAVGSPAESFVSGVGAGADGTTVASVIAGSGGITVGKGDIDLSLAQGEGALVALGTDGHFLRASRYAALSGTDAKVALLADGTVLFAGAATASSVLAKGTPKEKQLSSGLFYARFTSSLELDWARVLDIPADPYGTAFLPDGSIVVVGSFTFTVTLGAGSANETTFTDSDGNEDGFLAKFDTTGQLVWATHLSGAHKVFAYTLGSAPDGSVWVTGDYGAGLTAGTKDTLSLGTGTANALTLETSGRTAFVARFTPDGKPAWVTPFEDDMFFHTAFLSASPNALISAGEFQGTGRFGASGPSLTTGGGIRAFVARLGP